MLHTTESLREKWLDFWRKKDHTVISSASVIPENDPTALFHNAGMHPLVPFLMGEKHPAGKRLANAQKCIRTGDIENVGDAVHLTFFEMLGNWSLGDFFKKEQIEWSFEFLTQVLKLPVEKLAVSVFAGDKNAPRDEESAEIWKKCGIERERIAFLPASENWWAKGDTGPCGPDTEMFYWSGTGAVPENFQKTCDDPQWVEIWNDVFMEFNRDENGKLSSFSQKNIDTGMGLERTVMVLNGFSSVYETDAFTPLLQKIAELCCPKNPEKARKHCIVADPAGTSSENHSARIIADHMRAACIMLSDGIAPSNTDQGYILRRLIRRAIRHGRQIGIEENMCREVAKAVIEKLSSVYKELEEKQKFIFQELEREEAQFRKALITGEKEFKKMADRCVGNEISGTIAFHLYETYGFPLEMIRELAAERGMTVDTSGFQVAFESHQKLSRTGSEKKFAGGLADHSEETKKLHTATHLLHAALRKVLGDHAEQRGSNITADRLRFDFSHDEKMTPEQIAEVEKLVNEAITADLPITHEEMTVEEAKKAGAIGLFGHKYGEKVKVYTMGGFSKEICGGPHMNRTGELKHFKITKQESCGRGIRRVKAVIGD